MQNINVNRLAVAGSGALIGLIPLLFPQWISVIAEAYTAPGYGLEKTAYLTGNENTVNMAQTIAAACADPRNNNSAFQRDCLALQTGTTHDVQNTAHALAVITVDQMNAMNMAASQQAQAGIAIASARLSGARLASGIAAFQTSERLAAQLLYGVPSGGGASADTRLGGMSAFFNVKYLNEQRDRDRYTFGHDQDGWYFALGMDYRLAPNLIVGAMFDYTQTETEFKISKSKMDIDGWGLAAYGTYFWNQGGFLEGIIGFTKSEYDLTRRIAYRLNLGNQIVDVAQIAKAKPDADVFYASLGGGYSFAQKATTLTLQASLNYSDTTVDRYRESLSNPAGPGSSWAVAVEKQSYTSLTSRLGFMLTHALSTDVGVVVPQLSLHWVHEFAGEQERINAHFLADRSGTRFQIRNSTPDRNYFDLGVGLSAQFAQGRSAFISANRLLGYDNKDDYTVAAGMRLEF